jgi:hypothetical protein
MHFLRKKDQQCLNKEFLNSTFFYLRLHPTLFKEKVDHNHEKQQISADSADLSLEWRQYCLDPLYTNYSQTIQEMLQTTDMDLNQMQTVNASANSKMTAVPLSPSYILATKNPNSTYLFENNPKMQQTPSLPSTPSSILQISNQNVFQYPPLKTESTTATTANKAHKNPIKNLTPHFMMNNSTEMDYITEDYVFLNNKKSKAKIKNEKADKKSFFFLFQKQKSKSDTNLYLSNNNLDADGRVILLTNTTKSETRDSNIRDPSLNLKSKVYGNQTTNTMDSSTNTYQGDICLSQSQTSINLLSNDALTEYLTNLNQQETNADSSNLTINKLKQENNHLFLQLIYERHLRDKYEQDSNRLHFYKIERDQLKVEKSFLEKNLKQLIEQYKDQVDECLNQQNKLELNAYKSEAEEKDLIISDLQLKLSQAQNDALEWSQKCKNIQAHSEKVKLDYGTVIQSLENELNLKTKNEIDATYLKSLRFSNETLRKKLLLSTKAQQTLLNTFNQNTMSQLKEVIEIYNNPLLLSQLISTKREHGIASCATAEPELNKSQTKQSGSISHALLGPIFEYQQETLQKLQNEIQFYKSSCEKMLVQYNEMGIKSEQCQRSLELEKTKSNELDQSLDNEVVNKAELIKNHNRIESSLINVNKRLEEEIVKLKANLREQVLANSKIVKENETLKVNKYESIRMFVTQLNQTEQSSSESQLSQNLDH